MLGEKIKPQLEKVKVEDYDNITSLYHSPFDYNLLYMLCFAKQKKLNIILDDIDNLGVNREKPAKCYRYEEKYFYSKTKFSNIRALTLTIPKHLLVNLSDPLINLLEERIKISNIKNLFEHSDTVEHWIYNLTKKYGVNSLVGPDLAFGYINVNDYNFRESIATAKNNILKLLKNILPKNYKSNKDFVEWLFAFKKIQSTISQYFIEVLDRIIKEFDLQRNINKVGNICSNYENGGLSKLINTFDQDRVFQMKYIEALKIDNKKDFHLPFYKINKDNGKRTLHVSDLKINNETEISAPNVFMLSGYDNIVLPMRAHKDRHIIAREFLYQSGFIRSNQIFCDDKWTDKIYSYDLDIFLDETERYFYGTNSINLQSMPEIIKNAREKFLYSQNTEEIFKSWVILSTDNALKNSYYPLLFFIIMQGKMFYNKLSDMYKINLV